MKDLSLMALLGAVFLLFTLSNEEAAPLILNRTVAPKGRGIATGDSPKCLRDRFDPEVLKEEVRQLEEALDTNRLQGSWEGMALAEMPTSRALFFTKYGDRLKSVLPGGVGACTDVPCVYNLIYQTPEGVAGLVHYLWFLRTGSYLAADNMVPEQASETPGVYNGKTFEVSDYLFSPDELYGFWRLGKMLRAPHTGLTYLSEVHRIPRGERFEGKNSVSCGLAHSSGWINLSDGCLIVYPGSDSGYFFHAVTHELSHQVDFEDGKRQFGELYRSKREDYLKLSGFELKEYLDPAGRLIRQWSLTPEAKPVSSYAGTSPMENFAELLALYRIEASKTKGSVEDSSYQFAAAYYGGMDFRPESLEEAWVKAASSRKLREILGAVSNCDSQDCAEKELDLLVSEELGKIRSQEVDGCKVLTDPLVGQSLPSRMRESFSAVARKFQSETSPELRVRLATLLNDFLKPDVAYESFFVCSSAGGNCYAEEVGKRKSEELSDLGGPAAELLSLYLSTYSFGDVQTEITSFYKSLLSSRESSLRLKADELWESCKKIPISDALAPAGEEFIVREGYMVSSFYNCLNQGVRSAREAALSAVKLSEFAPRNPAERAFIMELLKPRFTQILEDHLRRGRAEEVLYRDAFVTQYGDWLFRTMRSNRWWVPRGRVDQLTLESACQENAQKMIGGEIYFHLKKELYKDLLEKTCSGIR